MINSHYIGKTHELTPLGIISIYKTLQILYYYYLYYYYYYYLYFVHKSMVQPSW